MSDTKTIGVYDVRAADYARENDAHANEDAQLGAFIAACPSGGKVLDLGCGPGAAASRMAESGLKVDATDASAEMIALAAKHPGVTARQATFDQIGGTAIYDGIWASFSLLHASRAAFPDHLAALHTALKPNGIFCIGMKLDADIPTTMFIGVIGALIGGLVLRLLISVMGWMAGFVGAVLGAMLVIWLWQKYFRN